MQPSRRRPAAIARRGDGQATRKHRPDYVLIAIMLSLLVVGLIVIYSIGPGLGAQKHVSENHYVAKQLLAIAIGAVTFGVMSAVPLHVWRSLKMPLIAAAIVATLIALVIPVSPDYPAHRWVRFGGLSFQSVELIKFAIIFVFGAFLVDRYKRNELTSTDKMFKPLIVVVIVLGIVVAKLQSDLGSMAVMVAMMAAMVYVVGLPLKKIAMFAGIIIIGGVLAISTSAYRRDRLLTFVHPERDCQSAGYQACQALIAVGSGGVVGKGLGQSVQAYGYLPEAANDSIFAIYAEKFGFFGVTLLVGLFMALFTRLKTIIERAPDLYSRLVVTGILAWLSTQAIINIGAMLGVLPLKGITLPFVSYGGTSIIFVTAAIGLAYNISRYTTYGVNTDIEERTSNDNSAYGRRVRGAYHPGASSRL